MGFTCLRSSPCTEALEAHIWVRVRVGVRVAWSWLGAESEQQQRLATERERDEARASLHVAKKRRPVDASPCHVEEEKALWGRG